MAHDTFNYDNLGQIYQDRPDEEYFSLLRMASIFYQIGLKSERMVPEDGYIPIDPPRGWKFHISIDDTEPDNLARGWNIVKDILMDNRVINFKVVRPEYHMHESFAAGVNQRGKQITIYAFYQMGKPLAYWQNLVFEITRQLAENHIRPSYRPEDDEPVLGSHYVSYRHDGGARGAGFNPERYDNPFAHLAVEGIDNQPDIPDWQPPVARREPRERDCSGCKMT